MLFEDVDNNELFMPRPKLRINCFKNKNINFEFIHRGFFISAEKVTHFLETNHIDFFDGHTNSHPIIPSTFSYSLGFYIFCAKYCYNFCNLFTYRTLRVATKNLPVIPDEGGTYDFSGLELGSELKLTHDACRHILLVLNSISTSKVFININVPSYSCTKCNLCKGRQGLHLLKDYFVSGPKISCTNCLEIVIERAKGNVAFENLFVK